MDNLPEASEFSQILDDALAAAQSLRQGAEALSENIDTTPQKLLDQSRTFENHLTQIKPAMDRLVDVLKNAHHHTLESAYRAMMADEAQISEAQKIRKIINEYHQVKAVIASSERRINEALLGVEASPWAVPSDQRLVRENGIIAEA
jgi:methyl-accepting chemotaxis protein